MSYFILSSLFVSQESLHCILKPFTLMETIVIMILRKLNSNWTINCNLPSNYLRASWSLHLVLDCNWFTFGRYVIWWEEKNKTFQLHKNEYFLSFVQIRMGIKMNGRICILVYNIMAVLLKCNINWRIKAKTLVAILFCKQEK